MDKIAISISAGTIIALAGMIFKFGNWKRELEIRINNAEATNNTLSNSLKSLNDSFINISNSLAVIQSQMNLILGDKLKL